MTSSTFLLPNVEFRRSARALDALMIVSASVALGLAAQAKFQLPFTPVPVTGQTLALALIGLLLGSRRGAMAVVAYLLQGACGAPVFAGLSGGAHVFVGPTAGYLFAMPAAAALCGVIAERGWDRRPLGSFAAVLLSSVLVLGFGTMWLSMCLHNLKAAAIAGLAPFVPGEIVKAAVVAAVLPALWSLKRRA